LIAIVHFEVTFQTRIDALPKAEERVSGSALICIHAHRQSCIEEIKMGSKANIVLVHGAWADGSSWSQVIPLLQQKEFNVTAAQIPLTSLADDIAVTRNLLAAQKGPTIPRMEPSAVLTSFAKALSPFR
jgi:hypothetical protein